jgi:methyl-accepting chemotaxis protein
MKISQRLFALSAFSAAGLLCVAGVSWYAVTSIQADLQTLTLRAAPLQAKTYELQERTERAMGGLLKLSLTHSKSDADTARAAVEQDLAAIDSLRKELKVLDPQAKTDGKGQTIDFRASTQDIVAAVAKRLDDEAVYRLESEHARTDLKKAEEAVGATRVAVQQIGVEAGKTADKAQDATRRLAHNMKLALSAQSRLKEIAIVVSEVDTASNRFRLGPLKEKFKSAVDAIARLEPEAGSDDVLKDARAAVAAAFEAFGKEGAGLLALRANVLASKADAEAAYQKQRRAILAPVEEQANKLGTVLDNTEVLAVKQRQALEAALKLRNEPGGVVTVSDDVSMAIRDMVGQVRLLMLATTEAEAKSAEAELKKQAQQLASNMASMRAGLIKMGRPQMAAEVDVAIKAMASVDKSVGSVAGAKISLLASENSMRASMDKLKATAVQQASVGEAQVKQMSQRQRDVASAVDARVSSSLAVILGISALIIVATTVMGWRTTRSITQRLNEAVRVAEEVSRGELTAVPTSRGSDETARLMNALSTMVGTLTGIVGNIRTAATQIDVGSNEISLGNQDLSVRTEQQASQLQQTAASIEELGATVRQNAESARHANSLAGDASKVAERGGVIVSEVVNTMGEIERSSQQIGEIVAVIDGIAFQTNILALNAAVEAARAGEQGRGFAVVAAEVRALALKSGDAARQVKAIVDTSVGKINAGSAQVRDAGSTMQDIVTQVRKVTDLIAEIARASSEQATSVGSVGQAVSQLDTLTQQNAALSEQGSAAAMSLRRQAEGLTQAIAAFQLQETVQAVPAVA